MTTIFFDKQTYREYHRSPHSAARCHAVCRKLTGCASQESLWYGAHYRAACAVLSRDPDYKLWSRSFAAEVRQCRGDDAFNYSTLEPKYKALWHLALRRVTAIANEALALRNSLDW